MHSVWPHLHSTAECESVHSHEHHAIAFCLSIGGGLLYYVILSFISSGLAGNHHRYGGGRQATEEGCYRLFSVAEVASAIGMVGTCGN